MRHLTLRRTGHVQMYGGYSVGPSRALLDTHIADAAQEVRSRATKMAGTQS